MSCGVYGYGRDGHPGESLYDCLALGGRIPSRSPVSGCHCPTRLYASLPIHTFGPYTTHTPQAVHAVLPSVSASRGPRVSGASLPQQAPVPSHAVFGWGFWRYLPLHRQNLWQPTSFREVARRRALYPRLSLRPCGPEPMLPALFARRDRPSLWLSRSSHIAVRAVALSSGHRTSSLFDVAVPAPTSAVPSTRMTLAETLVLLPCLLGERLSRRI